ncbi:MAG: hemerythrin domain-containing protein [Nitrospiraceae bacterium]
MPTTRKSTRKGSTKRRVSTTRRHAVPRKRQSRSKSGRSSASHSQTDAVQMLKDDHARVRSLFEDYETSGGEDKIAIGEKIITELEIHAQLEEDIFYPAFEEQADNEGKALVNEALDEHASMKEMIRDLKDLGSDHESYAERFDDLMQVVMHHVQDEETEMLPQAEETLADNLDSIGIRMAKQKRLYMRDKSVAGR